MQFITFHKDQLLDLHMLMVDRYGGRMGIISSDVLDSVVDMPQQVYFGQLRFVTPLQQIAAVIYGLVRRQPFVSQNETTALLLLLFLTSLFLLLLVLLSMFLLMLLLSMLSLMLLLLLLSLFLLLFVLPSLLCCFHHHDVIVGK